MFTITMICWQQDIVNIQKLAVDTPNSEPRSDETNAPWQDELCTQLYVIKMNLYPGQSYLCLLQKMQ